MTYGSWSRARGRADAREMGSRVKGRVWVSDFGFSGFGFLVLGTGSKGYRKSGEERIRIVLA